MVYSYSWIWLLELADMRLLKVFFATTIPLSFSNTKIKFNQIGEIASDPDYTISRCPEKSNVKELTSLS